MRYRLIGKLRQKRIYLTFHAHERCHSRKISVSEVLQVLAANLINLPGKGTTRKIMGTIQGRHIVVYCEETPVEIVVTTVAANEV